MDNGSVGGCFPAYWIWRQQQAHPSLVSAVSAAVVGTSWMTVRLMDRLVGHAVAVAAVDSWYSIVDSSMGCRGIVACCGCCCHPFLKV